MLIVTIVQDMHEGSWQAWKEYLLHGVEHLKYTEKISTSVFVGKLTPLMNKIIKAIRKIIALGTVL